jgi:hypothetical protein
LYALEIQVRCTLPDERLFRISLIARNAIVAVLPMLGPQR